jgi:hypothetical protein
MSKPILLLPALVLVLGCRSASELPSPPPEEEIQRRFMDDALREIQNGGSPEAEAYLAAAGSRAVPELREILGRTEDPDTEGRLKSLLLYAAEDTGLTVDEQVEVLLYDLSRDEPHPFLGVKALDRILGLGEEAIPPLEHASTRRDARGRAARILLSRLREAE